MTDVTNGTDSSKTILVVGKGAREHAIVKKLRSQDPLCKIHVAPGNGGTLIMANVTNLSHLDESNVEELIDHIQKSSYVEENDQNS